MKVKDLTAQSLAEYARFSLGAEEYASLPDETRAEIEMALTAAKGYVESYCGISLADNDKEELTLAVLVIGAEMLDNRQMTAQYTAQNPLVLTILGMHSVNLLPGEAEFNDQI